MDFDILHLNCLKSSGYKIESTHAHMHTKQKLMKKYEIVCGRMAIWIAEMMAALEKENRSKFIIF